MTASKLLVAVVSAYLLSSLSVIMASPIKSCGLPEPTIEGPITGGSRGRPFSSYSGGDISKLGVGYVEEEYFISGTAHRYIPINGLPLSGLWELKINNTDTYKTRILVRYPKNKKDFNGDVIIEWSNVSGGFDLILSDPPGVYEAGYVYAAVTAQQVGVSGQAPNPMGLVQWDPERYGTLHVEDDALSYDIYTQAAQAIRAGKVAGIKPKYILGIGESQSGQRINGYVNGIQPRDYAYDALIPVIAAGNANDFSPVPAHPIPNVYARGTQALVRKDLKTPTFTLNSETEGIQYANNTRQPDTRVFREWEIAGAAHGNSRLTATSKLQLIHDGILPAGTPISSAGSVNASSIDWRPCLDAIYRHCSKWVRGEGEPPSFPKFGITTNSTGQHVLARDKFGSVIGGLRLPEETVPIAAYSGEANFLSGATWNYTQEHLKQLYPTHKDYELKIKVAVGEAVAQGALLENVVSRYVNEAKFAAVP